jgi:predicted metal-dependent HD superfamily phosphohydrolase
VPGTLPPGAATRTYVAAKHLATLIAEASPDADAHYLADALLAPLATSLFVYQRRERGMSTDRIKAGLEYLLAGL